MIYIFYCHVICIVLIATITFSNENIDLSLLLQNLRVAPAEDPTKESDGNNNADKLSNDVDFTDGESVETQIEDDPWDLVIKPNTDTPWQGTAYINSYWFITKRLYTDPNKIVYRYISQ